MTGLEKETPRLLPPIDTARSRLCPLTVNTGPVVTPHRHDEGLLSPSFALHHVVNVHSGFSPRVAPGFGTPLARTASAGDAAQSQEGGDVPSPVAESRQSDAAKAAVEGDASAPA